MKEVKIKTTVTNLLSQTPEGLLSHEEEKNLTRLAHEGDSEARKKLVIHNDRLVVSIAQKYRDNGVPLEDLVMAGFVGLLEGIDRYNPENGNKLSTYTTWWIKKKILGELNQNSSTITYPHYVRELKRKLEKVEIEQGRELTISEVRERFDVTKERARLAKKATFTRSLDASVSEDREMSLKKLVENQNAELPSKSALEQLQAEKLKANMKRLLTERERRVIKLYYGLKDHQPRTLNEVGEVFGISLERVRQLKDEALDKLSTVKELRTIRVRYNCY